MLPFAALLPLIVAIGVEVTRAVGGVHLVNEVNLAVLFAEFVFGIHQDEASPGGHFRAAPEQRPRVGFQLRVVLLTHNALPDDLLAADVLVVAFFSLGSRRNDRLREGIAFAQAIGHGYAADAAFAGLVLPPGMAGEIAPDDHLHADGFALQTYRHVGVGRGEQPVGHDVARGLEKIHRRLVEHLSFVRNGLGQDVVKSGDAVGSDHDEQVADSIYVAYLAAVKARLAGELKVCFEKRLHDLLIC